ncbi:MAG: hypothetical protein FWE31_01590 [Firmicutes bacterium]|nr:hypothetical protein [Bacillota bacterium]
MRYDICADELLEIANTHRSPEGDVIVETATMRGGFYDPMLEIHGHKYIGNDKRPYKTTLDPRETKRLIQDFYKRKFPSHRPSNLYGSSKESKYLHPSVLLYERKLRSFIQDKLPRKENPPAEPNFIDLREQDNRAN